MGTNEKTRELNPLQIIETGKMALEDLSKRWIHFAIVIMKLCKMKIHSLLKHDTFEEFVEETYDVSTGDCMKMIEAFNILEIFFGEFLEDYRLELLIAKEKITIPHFNEVIDLIPKIKHLPNEKIHYIFYLIVIEGMTVSEAMVVANVIDTDNKNLDAIENAIQLATVMQLDNWSEKLKNDCLRNSV